MLLKYVYEDVECRSPGFCSCKKKGSPMSCAETSGKKEPPVRQRISHAGGVLGIQQVAGVSGE